MVRSRIGVAVAFAAMASVPASGWGREGLVLRWTAPPTCPDGNAVVAEVDELLGEGPRGNAEKLAVRVQIRQTAKAWVLRLERIGSRKPERRRLRAESCDLLADAAAVIIALMIDPTTELVLPQGPGGASLEVDDPVLGEEAETRGLPSLGAGETGDARLAVRMALWAAASGGGLPGMGVGAGLGAILLVERWRFELGGEVWPMRSAPSSELAGAGGKVGLYQASLAGWYALVAGEVDVGVSVGLDVGWMYARGYGVSDPGEGSTVWLAATGGLRSSWSAAGPIGLVLRVDGVAPISRPDFVLENVGRVHRVGLGARVSFGVEWR